MIKEYANSVDTSFTQRHPLVPTPIQLLGDECSVLFTSIHRVNKEGTCYDHVFGSTLHFSTKPFKINLVSLYYPDAISKILEKMAGSQIAYAVMFFAFKFVVNY